METVNKQFRKRNAILTCLQNTDSHPSAEMVHEMLRPEHPDISLATIYRNLALFKTQKLIQSLGTVNGIERFDANTAPHVHFICEDCGRVQDLPQIHPPQELSDTASRCSGGQVTGCQLSFSGTCRECQNNV